MAALIPWVRSWARVPHTLRRMERFMSRLSEQLDAANSQLSAVQGDVRVLLDRATVPAEDTEAQAAADRLTAFTEAFRAETPDADGSDTPADPESLSGR